MPIKRTRTRIKCLSVRLTEAEFEGIRKKASDKGFGTGTLVRSLIKDFLKQQG